MRIDREKITISKKKIEKFIKSNSLPIGTKYCSLYKTNILRSRKFLSRIFTTNKDINKYIETNKPINFKNVEDLLKYELLSIGLCDQDYKIKDYEKILKKFYKFWKKLIN